jgi:hypothetical protein
VDATTNPVLHYMAILKAATAFGLSRQEAEAVAHRFDPRVSSPEEVADALADLILARRAR